MNSRYSFRTLWDLPIEPAAITISNCKLLFSTISEMIKCYCPSHCGSLLSENLVGLNTCFMDNRVLLNSGIWSKNNFIFEWFGRSQSWVNDLLLPFSKLLEWVIWGIRAVRHNTWYLFKKGFQSSPSDFMQGEIISKQFKTLNCTLTTCKYP